MPLRNLPIKTGHLFLGLAVVMFILTVALFSGGKKETPKQVVKEIPTQKVVVPLVPISEGKTISINDVTAVKWPSEFLPKGTTFEDPYELTGRVAKQDLFPGEPIFKQKVSGADTRGGLPAVIPKGMRAVSVAVTEIKGVAGFVKPGDRVDVLTTFEVDDTRITRTVLQNVLVLASAQTMVNDGKYAIDTPDGVARGEASLQPVEEKAEGKAADKNKKDDKNSKSKAKAKERDKKESEKAARLVSSVTLALTPEQTETLALAEITGEIRLALRPETDHGLNQLGGVNFSQLLGKPQRKAQADPGTMPPAPAMPAGPSQYMLGTQVEFIQGTDKRMYNFNE